MKTNKEPVHHLYVHFPFCQSKCAYCGFYSVVCEDQAQQNDLYAGYMKSLAMEFDYCCSQYDLSDLRTIFIGGGSPSCISSFIADFHTVLTDTLMRYNISLHKSHLSEWTAECNPAQITPEFVSDALSAGISRLSIGIQSFCDEALSRFGRHQTTANVISALDAIQAYSDRMAINDITVSVDLINHLMLSHNDITEEVSQLSKVITQYDIIRHISIYDLTFDEGSRICKDRSVRREYELRDDISAEYSDAVTHLLQDNGFVRYEVSNWCRPGYECRHNLGYWHYHNYIGLGPAAHGTVGSVRIENSRDLISYISDWQSIRRITELTLTEQIEEYLLMNMRLPNKPIADDFCARFGRPLTHLIPRTLAKYQQHGWLTDDIAVTDAGLDYLNAILTDIFTEL